MTSRTREYKSDFARRYFSEGKAEGKAEEAASLVVMFLDDRGIELTGEQLSRIVECDDLELLHLWVRRATTVTSAEELFS